MRSRTDSANPNPKPKPRRTSPDSKNVLIHTTGHRAGRCPACDFARKAMIQSSELARLKFPDAAGVWIESHRFHISEVTAHDYQNYIRALKLFFSNLTLAEIHIGHFEQYQKMRHLGDGFRKAGPSRVNHELNTLSQILARAALWAPIAPYYKPLRLPRPSVGCALTQDQEKTLFQVACTKHKWKVAYLCSLITCNTTCGPGEIRMLRMMDVDLTPTPDTPNGTIRIVLGAKNEFRNRTIPLNVTASVAIRELWKRALELGSVEPQHFLLPHRAPKGEKGWDSTRPTSSWRKAWNKLREAAGLPHLRMYDLRHHVITKLLEDESVPERTVIELAGQVSRKMLDTYSHIRMRSKLQGVMTLEKVAVPDPNPLTETPEKKPPGRVSGSAVEPSQKVQ